MQVALPIFVLLVVVIMTRRVLFALASAVVTACLVSVSGVVLSALLLFYTRVAEVLTDSLNLRSLLFVILLGMLANLMSESGAVLLFAKYVKKRLASKIKGQFVLIILAFLTAIDDYLSTLTRGVLARSLSRESDVSANKYAYQVHGTSFSMHILFPLSSTAIVIIAILQATPAFQSLQISPIHFFIKTIPYNLYALLAMMLVIITSISSREVPALRKANDAVLAQSTDDGAPGKQVGAAHHLDFALLVFPLPVLAAALFLMPLVAQPGMDLATLLEYGDISMALLWALAFMLIGALLFFWLARGFALPALLGWSGRGALQILPVCLILTFGWTFGLLMNLDLDTHAVVSNVFGHLLIGSALIPVLFFILSAITAALIGCPWSSLALLLPIVLHAGLQISPDQSWLVLCGAAAISGVVLGDQISPISDLSILTASSLGISPVQHSSTQILLVAVTALSALLGFVLLGIGQSLLLVIGITLLVELTLFRLVTQA
ncbi:MAG: Na+/H+ antiporter NhaC family protein [Caldilineaceae bacterium]